jgi:hypothetical protein
MKEEWTFKAKFQNKTHMFVVKKHDPVLYVRQEISRHFDLTPENVQMKTGYPWKQFNWNKETRVHEVLRKMQTILIQKGPSKVIEPIDFGDEDFEQSTWDEEDDSANESCVHQEQIRREMEKFLEQRQIRLAQPKRISKYLKIILEREHYLDQFYEAKDIKQIISFKLQLEYYYNIEVAEYLGSIIGCFCGSEEFLKTLSDRERLELHFFEVVDKNPSLENKRYFQLRREEMLEFMLENCKLAPPPLKCNKLEFYKEVKKRHSFGELVTSYALEKDIFDFLQDSDLARKGATLLTTTSQYISLQFVDKESKEKEVKHWICSTCQWENEEDHLECYICQEAKIVSAVRVPAVLDKQTSLSNTSIGDDERLPLGGIFSDDLFNFSVQNGRNALDKTKTSKQAIQKDSVNPTSKKLTKLPKSSKKNSWFGSIFNWSKGKKGLNQDKKAENNSVDSHNIVPFDQFLNAYFLVNASKNDFDTIKLDAQELYNAVKSDSSLLLELFENLQRQALM